MNSRGAWKEKPERQLLKRYRRVQGAQKAKSMLCNKLDGCQNYGPFWGPYYNTAPNISDTPKRDHNFDNHPTDTWKWSVFHIQSNLSHDLAAV